MEIVLYILIMIYEVNIFYKDISIINNNKYNILVNKNNKLSNYFIPKDLVKIDQNYTNKTIYIRKKVYKSFIKMNKKANKNNCNLFIVSAYRSYSYQQKLFTNYKNNNGLFYALLCSSKPGHSEHQTGMAIDLSNYSFDYDNFEKTREFIWMKYNAYKYGFILRYPKYKYLITGFKYEPWHFRYVGKKLAKKLYKKNITLEEYKKK